jgi:hypothetical protein
MIRTVWMLMLLASVRNESRFVESTAPGQFEYRYTRGTETQAQGQRAKL